MLTQQPDCTAIGYAKVSVEVLWVLGIPMVSSDARLTRSLRNRCR